MRKLLFSILLVCGVAHADEQADAVMAELLSLLKNNDTPYENAGLEGVWEYAAPSNKAVTGPLPRFIEMVSRHPYVELLNHQSAETGEPRNTPQGRQYPIRLIAEDGQVAGYVWTLTQQSDDTWKTSAVMRVRVGDNLRGM